METIGKRVTDEERLERIKTLFPDEKEARDILAYDKLVDSTDERTEYDLPEEQEKLARKYCRTGTRKAPPAYNWKQKKERKPNATKGGIITELTSFLENKSSFAVENLTIPNKEGIIDFQIGERMYSVTLTQHNVGWTRKKQKGYY